MRRLRPWRRRGPGLLVVAAVTLASCGVSSESEPRAIPSGNVPEELLVPPEPPEDDDFVDDTAPPEGEADPDDAADQTDTEPGVWLIRSVGEAVELVRESRDLPDPRTMTGLLEALLLGRPDEDERARGVTTAIPEGAELASAPRLEQRDDDTVLVIDLTAGIWEVRGEDLRNAFAQIVCTVTEASEIAGLNEEERAVSHARFLVDGQRVPVLGGRGEEVSDPVACTDYRVLLPDS